VREGITSESRVVLRAAMGLPCPSLWRKYAMSNYTSRRGGAARGE